MGKFQNISGTSSSSRTRFLIFVVPVQELHFLNSLVPVQNLFQVCSSSKLLNFFEYEDLAS
ncbi:unnamed protein product [Meloidogyne enterolobii]|uniref:Uncharacterized protein n=1 Tax=Meloidogyne enterolobii TaxID=390850 RepID=A0ACB0XWG6_MELEN